MEENICDDVIYADHGRLSRLSTRGGLSLGYAHQLGVPVRGLQFGGVISGLISGIRVRPTLTCSLFFDTTALSVLVLLHQKTPRILYLSISVIIDLHFRTHLKTFFFQSVFFAP